MSMGDVMLKRPPTSLHLSDIDLSDRQHRAQEIDLSDGQHRAQEIDLSDGQHRAHETDKGDAPLEEGAPSDNNRTFFPKVVIFVPSPPSPRIFPCKSPAVSLAYLWQYL